MPSTQDRVRELIQRSSLSQDAFARRIGLDGPKLSKSLSGARRFSSLDLARISEICEVTVDWLITGEEPEVSYAARTTGGEAKTALRWAEYFATLRTDLTGLGFPQPWPAVGSAGRGTYQQQGRRLAQWAHARLADKGVPVPYADLPGVIETVFGADVAVVGLDEDFDGLAVSSSTVKLILLATTHLSSRQRFTLAHELGHLVAGDDQDVHLDEDVFDRTRQAKDPSEIRANAFAADFLMPERTLREAAGTTGFSEESFARLSCDLMVTPTALAFRLKELRLIDAGTCDRFRGLTAKDAAGLAGRGEELARLMTESSRPRPPGLLVRDTYAAYEAGAATLRPYARLIGADVEELRASLETQHGSTDAS